MELAHNQQIKRKDDELTELNSIITRETQLFQEKDMELQVKYPLRNTTITLFILTSYFSLNQWNLNQFYVSFIQQMK